MFESIILEQTQNNKFKTKSCKTIYCKLHLYQQRSNSGATPKISLKAQTI